MIVLLLIARHALYNGESLPEKISILGQKL
jgi:hypothetical protein